MRGIGACHQGLGRRAAVVDAGAAETLALGDCDFHAGRRQTPRQKWSRLAGADDDHIEIGHEAPPRQNRGRIATNLARLAVSHSDDPVKAESR